MRIVHQLTALFRLLFQSAQVDADLADEMRFHVERETEANIARGMHPDAARRAARLLFGSVDAAQEVSRDDRPGSTVRQLIRDARFGARLLRKAPVFGITSVAIVALGIGGATAIFSVVYGVMLRPLPYREPEQLVSIWLQRTTRNYPSAADAAELRRLRGVFADVAIVRSSTNINLVGEGEPRHLQGARVSANLFSVLGASPTLGRTFAPTEDEHGRDRVVILSDGLWRSHFGGDTSVVGRQLQLNGVMHTVIGIMPAEFQYPSANLDAWIPAVVEPDELTRRSTDNYRVVARLARGVTLDQARRDATALAKRLASTYRSNTGAGFSVDSMLDDAVRDIRPALTILLGAVSFLLLIACVNLSNLFGARASARSGEFAVRLALGASRARLVAQAIAEAVPVLLIGGVSGVLVAAWTVRLFVAAAPAGVPRVESIALNTTVLAFSLGALIFTGLAASVGPAVQALGSDFTMVTKDGGRASTAGRARSAARRTGVAVQIAFAFPLLAGASLLIRSALNVAGVELGFRPEGVVTWSFYVLRSKHPTDQAVADYFARLIDAVRAVPGVASAAIGNRIPLIGAQTNAVHFENPTGTADSTVDIDSRTVTPDYFATLGINLIAGRTFTEYDDGTSPVVGIIDDRVARTVWPGETVIGKRFRGPDDRWVTVVGVVAHVRTAGVDVDPRPQVYWSYRQWTQNRAVLAVRSRTEPRALFAPVVKAIRSVDPDQSVYDARPLPETVDRSLAQRRLTTALIAVFSAIALVLAAVGIYSVVAYGVTQRQREFGIRLALGATQHNVTRFVVWQSTAMAIAGSFLGFLFALAAAGVMRNLVYGVAPRDAASFAAAAALLLTVAGLASYIPARRAASVDPALTLRSE